MAKRKTAVPVTTRIATFLGSRAGTLAKGADALAAKAAKVIGTVRSTAKKTQGTAKAKNVAKAKKAVRR